MKKMLFVFVLALVACSSKTDTATVQGLPGPQGPTGPQGPQGIPGISCSIIATANGATVSCGDQSVDILNGSNGSNGSNGNDGQDGSNGVDGSSCSVVQQSNGAQITCSDSTVANILNGQDGQDGQDGQPGAPGALLEYYSLNSSCQSVDSGFYAKDSGDDVVLYTPGATTYSCPGGYSLQNISQCKRNSNPHDIIAATPNTNNCGNSVATIVSSVNGNGVSSYWLSASRLGFNDGNGNLRVIDFN